MIGRILSFWKNLGNRVKQYLKQWTRPVIATLLTGSLADMTRSKTDLIAENAMLRQQLIVLNRQVKHPQLTNGDRLRKTGCGVPNAFVVNCSNSASRSANAPSRSTWPRSEPRLQEVKAGLRF